MSEVALIIGLILNFCGAVALLGFAFLIIRSSSFRVLFLLAFSAYWVGLYIYPAFEHLGWIRVGGKLVYGKSQASHGLADSFHALLFSIGIWIGFGSHVFRFDKYLVAKIDELLSDAVEERFVVILVLSGVAAFSLFYYLVGFDVAMINAAAVRGGDLDGLGEDKKYLFLKTIGTSCLMSGSLLVYLLLAKKRLYVIFYLVLVIFAFLNSVSRSVVLANMILPFLVYLVIIYKRSGVVLGITKIILPTLALFVVGFVVLQYGKAFGVYVSAFFSGSDEGYDPLSEADAESRVSLFLNSFSYIWLSVDAGIENFLQHGPYVTFEPMLAIFFGWIPYGVLNSVGLGWAYYGDLDIGQKLACVNSAYFYDAGCTVPPLISGYSAYVFPFGGAALAGAAVGIVVKSLSRVWESYEGRDIKRLWVPYFLFMAFINFMTVIPGSIAYTFFALIMAIFLMRFIKVLSRISLF